MSEIFPARTIAIEVLACSEPAQQGEFNWWYDRVHIPRLTAFEGIVDAYRYRDMGPDYGDLGAHFMTPAGMVNRYMTICRLDSDDPWALMQEVTDEVAKQPTAGGPGCVTSYELSAWDLIACRRAVSPPLRLETHLQDGMPEAIFLVPVITDPARRAEQDEWWLYAHAHDLLETPGVVQCERYCSLNPHPAEKEATHLNIYEVDAGDPAAVLLRVLEDDRDVRKPTGRFIGGSARADSMARGIYMHCDPMGVRARQSPIRLG
jgi:hypothetical protein